MQEGQAVYHPAEHTPADIRVELVSPRPSEGENLAVLREHAPETRRHLVPVAGGHVEVFEVGAGPALVLMHGFNIGAGLFAKQFAALSSSYRLVVVHHPGVGATTAARDLSLDGIARLITEALDAVGIESPVHLLGTSFGGLVALSFALAYTDRSASLILVCSSYKASNRAGQVNRLSEVAAQDFGAILARSDNALLGRELAELESTLLRCESMEPQIGLRFLDEFAANPDMRSRLGEILVPTLVLSGGCDSVIPAETSWALQASIPNAVARRIDSAGHFPSLTHPDAFAEAITSFHSDLAVTTVEPAAADNVVGLTPHGQKGS